MSDNSETFWQKLKRGLSKSSKKMGDGLKFIFTNKKLDTQTLEDLEELLIVNDLGPETAKFLTKKLSDKKYHQNITLDEVKKILSHDIESLLEPYVHPFTLSQKPFIILITGVNGSGKTTTIAKLAHFFQQQNLKVAVAACDTFRAAAIEQLDIWSKRLHLTIYKKREGADPAAVAFDAVTAVKQEQIDVLLIDTAGRLHNKSHLMDELKKIIRVIQKVDITAPHCSLLVLDATVGQNAFNQVETFLSMISINGLIMTKLDGTAKGGVLIGLVQRFKLPVYAIGIGEDLDDLRPFTAKDFSFNLVNRD